MKKRLKIGLLCLMSVVVFPAFFSIFGGALKDIKAETGDSATVTGVPAEVATAEEAEKHGMYASAEERLATMTKVAAEGGRELYFDNTYGEVAVLDTQTKEVWFSSPYNYNSDLAASDDIKAFLASMIRLTYYDTSMTERSMNSYTDCVAKAIPQFTTEELENGIRLNMQLGLIETQMLLPSAAEASRFEEKVIKGLSEKDARKIDTYYTKISLSDPSLSDAVKSGYQEYYPGLLEMDFYILRNVSDREKRIIEKIIKTTAYTMEDLEDDTALSGYVSEEGVSALFNIPIEFTLNQGDLVVNVPAEQIVYDREEFVLSEIILCEFFGAGYTRNDGYLFVPDGSGTLIDYNTYREKAILYTTNTVYGDDYSLNNQWWYNSLKQQIHFPVFGNKENNKALLAIIEDGDAMAKIISESGNILSSYETVYPEFNYATTFTVNYQDETKMRGMYTYHDRNYYDGDYRIRYRLLTGESASYVGMANSYRNYLIDKGVLTKLEDNDINTPLYLEALGTIDKKDTFLGFSYDKFISLTSFEDAQTILTDLQSQGFYNLNMRYKGWMNGGLNSTVTNKMEVVKNLGGKKGLVNLLKFADENKMGIFPDADFYIVRDDGFFDGYNPSWNSPRTLSRQTSYLLSPQEMTNLAYLQFMFYAVSPNKFNQYFNQFFDDYDKLMARGVSIGNLGTMLYADYKKSAAVTRQQSFDLINENLKTYCADQYRFMTDGGNAYTLAYATDLLNVPLTDSAYTLSDTSIPFMQLVLHGYINYAGNAINLSSNMEDTLLKSIEYGSNLFFTIAYENSEELKETPYSFYYSIDYATLRQSIIDTYTRYNEIYRELKHQAMVDHTELSEKVYQTTFEDGTQIIVNYNQVAAMVNDITVEAKSFVVVR